MYAIATVKYIDKKFYFPDKQLETIINFPDSTGYEGKTSLDPLYLWILGDTFCVDDPVVCSKIRTVMGTVVLLVNPLPPSGIAELMGLETREVLPFLTSLQSLLVLDEDPSQPVKPIHKSFPDFITDPSCCADVRFYVSPEHIHLELITNCLRVMDDGLEQNILSLPDYALNLEVEDLGANIVMIFAGFLLFFFLSPKCPLIELRSTMTCFHIPYLILSHVPFLLSYLSSSFGQFGQKVNSVISDYLG